MKISKGVAKIIGVSIAILVPTLAVVFLLPTQRPFNVQAPNNYWPIDTTQEGIIKYQKIPPFSMINQLGDTINNSDMESKVIIADFIFTNCPGICPMMANQMVRVQSEFLENDDVEIFSFSVDPERDTLGALKDYADKNEAVPGKWHLLAGEKGFAHELSVDGFHLASGIGKDGIIYHSEKFVLIDKLNNIRGYYDGTDSSDVSRLMGDIVLILDGK